MRKKITMLTLVAMLIMPLRAYAREGLFWTVDGYRSVATNAAGESLLLGQSLAERDGFTQIIGVTFTIFGPEEHSRAKWSAFLGGDGADKLEHAVDTEDGWLAVGSSSSSDMENGWHPGEYDGKEAKTDGWIVRLDETGETIWNRCYGGSDWDALSTVCPARDGGWIAVGYTYSADGDVEGWHESGELFAQPDGWMLHIDDDGEILWQRALGGSDYDALYAVRQTPAGYLAVGVTSSADGDVSGLHGGTDAWAVLVDTDGTLISQACFGGTDDDDFTALSDEADGTWLAAGTSWSFDTADEGRDKSGWAVCLDAGLGARWTRRFGGAAGIEHTERVIAHAEHWTLAGYTQPIGEEASDWIIGIQYSGKKWALLKGKL